MFRGLGVGHRAVLCSVKGDPSTVEGFAWGGVPWTTGTRCPLLPSRNNYVAISSFKAADDKRWRRRKDQFVAMHAVMVDDVGTKLDLKRLPTGIHPTMVVETSPGNYQVTYFLTTPLYDQEEAETGIKQMIAMLTDGGADPGMAGVTRVLRLPGGVNAKPKYMQGDQHWRCRLAYWRPDLRLSWDEICRAYGIVHTRKFYVEPADGVTVERKRGFELVREGLGQLRCIKRQGRGWIDIRCPWVREHTDKADTGAAVAYPAKANGYMGGFRCHHGHCASRNWGDLEDWVAEKIIEEGRRTRGMFTGLIE